MENRLARWFSMYFPEYHKVYGKADAISGLMVLRAAPLPEDIVKLGAEGVNRIWREAKLRAVGMKRATSLVEAAAARRDREYDRKVNGRDSGSEETSGDQRDWNKDCIRISG